MDGSTEIPPEENSNRVLNDIRELLIQLSHLTPPICFDVPNLNRVAHPVSGMLEETLEVASQLSVVSHKKQRNAWGGLGTRLGGSTGHIVRGDCFLPVKPPQFYDIFFPGYV